jgi:hypothetical protein
MRETYEATRARLMRPPAGAAKPVPSGPDPAPRSPAQAAVREIIDAICGEIALTRRELLTDIHSDIAVEARKIAAALVVRRLPVERATAAEHFGIPEDSIASALQRVDLTLIARAIPRNADLGQTVRLVLADWQLHHDLNPSVPDVKRAVCAEFRISRIDIDSERREAHLIAPRHFAMALARRLTGRSLPFIGRHFGGRDHTTVLNAVRKMRPVIAAIEPRMTENATAEEWARAGRLALAEMAKRATWGPTERAAAYRDGKSRHAAAPSVSAARTTENG